MKQRRAFAGGFSLVEMLIAISLLGVFMTIAFRLVGANFDIVAANRSAEDDTVRFDGALRMLRLDVKDSTSIEMPSPLHLRIHHDDRIIDWQSDGNTISRAHGNQKNAWDVGQPVGLKLDGAIVLVTPNVDDQIAIGSPR